MKKAISALILGAGVAASFSASAAVVPIANGSQYDATSCILLGDTVTLNLSKSVVGAFNCDEANNVIKVATCHTAGWRVSGITCAVIGTDTSVTPNVPIYNNDACTGVAPAPGQPEIIVGADYRAYTAQSSGGSIGEAFLGGNCTQDKVNQLPQIQ